MNQRLNNIMMEAGYAAPELAGRANKLAELIVKHILEKMEKEIEHAYEVSDISTAATLQALSLDILDDFDMEIPDA